MIDYDKAIKFLDNTTENVEDVCLFKHAYQNSSQEDEWQRNYKVFTSEGVRMNGVMLMTQAKNQEADFRVLVSATTERSLRKLLLTFPRRSVGMFLLNDEWIANRILDLFQGEFLNTSSGEYFVGIKKGNQSKAEQRTVSKRKDEIASFLRKLTSLKGRMENSQFIVEGEMMVKRAFSDGLPIEKTLYTTEYISSEESRKFFKKAYAENLSIYQTSDGVMGSLTTTRPIPSIVASVHLNYPEFLYEDGHLNFRFSQDCLLLLIENVQNPDNLGMTLRTADASGVSAVLISGDGANPFHKNCIRASRGAIGRLPIFHVSSMNRAIEKLKSSGWNVIGATATAENDLYTMSHRSPTAVVVGNENSGLTDATRNSCTQLIRIPMAAGQSSLNVGVAAGILLYEIRRSNNSDHTCI